MTDSGATFHNVMNGIEMARCSHCDADLFAAQDGTLRCTRHKCRYRFGPHPAGPKENSGIVKDRKGKGKRRDT